MFEKLPIFITAFLIATAITCTLYFVRNIGKSVPKDERNYKDPLPFSMRAIWPLVSFFAHYLGRFLGVEYLQKSKKILQKAELIYLMEPEQFFGLRIVIALTFTVLSFTAFYLIDYPEYWLCLLFGVLGYYMPFLSANDRRKVREKNILKSLPTTIDFIVMSLEAGMNLNGGFQQAVEKGPSGPLSNELNIVLRDIRAGMSQRDALKLMAERTNLKETDVFITSIAQAQKTGASLADTLRIQARQRRLERFQRAEKLALEAPVKLVFPLVTFIFPCTFVVIFFPIVLKFLAEV